MNVLSSRSNPIDVHVGNRLRLLRLQKGMTQEELGSLVGVSYQQIQKYETGSNRISASRLYFLAMQLSVGPEYFFGDLDASAIEAMNSNVTGEASGQRTSA